MKGPEIILTCSRCEFYERIDIENHFCTSLKSGEKRKLDVLNFFVIPDQRYCPYYPKIQYRCEAKKKGFAKHQ